MKTEVRTDLDGGHARRDGQRLFQRRPRRLEEGLVRFYRLRFNPIIEFIFVKRLIVFHVVLFRGRFFTATVQAALCILFVIL